MISDISKKWIEACKILTIDPTPKVKCPECQQNDLKVQNIINEESEELVEIKFFCTACGAKNYLRL